MHPIIVLQELHVSALNHRVTCDKSTGRILDFTNILICETKFQIEPPPGQVHLTSLAPSTMLVGKEAIFNSPVPFSPKVNCPTQFYTSLKTKWNKFAFAYKICSCSCNNISYIIFIN